MILWAIVLTYQVLSSGGDGVKLKNIKEGELILVGVPPTGKIEVSGGEVVDLIWARRNRIAVIRGRKGVVSVRWSKPYVRGVAVEEEGDYDKVLKGYVVNWEEAKKWKRRRRRENKSRKRTHGYKILTKEEGIYRITYEELVKVAPEVVNSNPQKLKILWKNMELPIVVKGEEDGRFEEGDWIEFFAKRREGEGTYLNLYSNTNVFWLEWEGKRGARMVKIEKEKKEEKMEEYWEEIHFEKDSIYIDYLSSPDTIDPWFWFSFEGEGDVIVHTPYPTQEGECSLKIGARISAINNGECIVKINDNIVGKFNYSTYMRLMKEYTVSFESKFLEEENKITFTPEGETVILLNYLKVKYKRKPIAYNGRIKFVPTEKKEIGITIKNFSRPTIRMWNVGSAVVEGEIVYEEEVGKYKFECKLTPECSTFYYAQDYIMKPIEIKKVEFRLKENRAKDYIIITNSKLYECAKVYQTYLETKGFKVEVVKVEEIYDEFNYGLEEELGIQKFLKYAFENWSSSPEYVLLLGDGSFDYRDILKGGRNIVPIISIYGYHKKGFISLDNLNACISGEDPCPDMFIGRIPVKDEEEFYEVFYKIKEYEEKQLLGDWRLRFIVASDSGSDVFPTTRSIVESCFISPYEVKKAFFPEYYEVELVEEINEGTVVLTYIGHSSLSNWTGDLLWRETIPTLTNWNRLPFIQVLGCYNGLFADPEEECMGEVFLREKGGGIGYWGPGGGLYSRDKGLVKGTLERLFNYQENTIGMLTLAGILRCFKETGVKKTVLQQVLLGEPSLKITIPQKEVRVEILPKTVRRGEWVKIKAEIPKKQNGQGVVKIYTQDTLPYKNITEQIINGEMVCSVKIEEMMDTGKVRVVVYGKTGTQDFVGEEWFSVITPYISPVWIIPSEPTRGDSVFICAKIFDPEGMEWVRCMWRVGERVFSVIGMKPTSEGYFVTTRGIPPQESGTKVEGRVEVKRRGDRIYTEGFSYQVRRNPDFTMKGRPKLKGEEEVEIEVEVKNTGGKSDSCMVRIYAKTEAESILVGESNVFVERRKEVEVSYRWKFRDVRVVVNIDPENKVEEEDESNNYKITKLINNLFDVTPEKGSDGWIYSKDKGFGCYIQEKGVNVKGVAEIKDTIGGYKIGFRRGKMRLTKPMKIKVKKGRKEGGIYKLVEKYNKWIFLHSDTICEVEEEGVFRWREKNDTIGPKIRRVNFKNDTTLLIEEEVVGVEWKLLLIDENGIDVVRRKIKTVINGDTLAENCISYPTEITSIYELPVTIRGNLTIGEHIVKFVGYDFEGNRGESELKINVQPKFKPDTTYYWGNYPNPVTGEETKFYFQFSTPPEKVEVELYTISGRLVKRFEVRPSTEKVEIKWNLEVGGKKLGNGVYFYTVEAKKGNEIIKKTMKMAILR